MKACIAAVRGWDLHGCVQMVSRTRMADAAPLKSVRDEEDGFICWFEAWASALKRGYYQVSTLTVGCGLLPATHLRDHASLQEVLVSRMRLAVVPSLLRCTVVTYAGLCAAQGPGWPCGDDDAPRSARRDAAAGNAAARHLPHPAPGSGPGKCHPCLACMWAPG